MSRLSTKCKINRALVEALAEAELPTPTDQATEEEKDFFQKMSEYTDNFKDDDGKLNKAALTQIIGWFVSENENNTEIINLLDKAATKLEDNNKDKHADIENARQEALSKIFKKFVSTVDTQKKWTIAQNYKNILMANKKAAISNLLSEFADKIPVYYREDIIEQMSTLFTSILNEKCSLPAYVGMKRSDVLREVGIAEIFQNIKRAINSAITKYTENIETNKNVEGFDPTELEERIRILNLLIDKENPNIWLAAVNLTTRDLTNAEKLHCAVLGGEQLGVFEDELDQRIWEDSSWEDAIEDAEETTLERWMLKADTISAIKGISAEVRQLFATVLKQEKGILYARKRYNIANVYTQLINVRHKYKCTGSKSFIAALQKHYVYLKKQTGLTPADQEFMEFLKLPDKNDPQKTYESFINRINPSYKKPKDGLSAEENNKRRKEASQRAILATKIFRNFDKSFLRYSTIKAYNNNGLNIDLFPSYKEISVLVGTKYEQGVLPIEKADETTRTTHIITKGDNEEEVKTLTYFILKKPSTEDGEKYFFDAQSFKEASDLAAFVANRRNTNKENPFDSNIFRQDMEIVCDLLKYTYLDTLPEFENLSLSFKEMLGKDVSEFKAEVGEDEKVNMDIVNSVYSTLDQIRTLFSRIIELNQNKNNNGFNRGNKGLSSSMIESIMKGWISGLRRRNFPTPKRQNYTDLIVNEKGVHFNKSTYFEATPSFFLSKQLEYLAAKMPEDLINATPQEKQIVKDYLERTYLNNKFYAIKENGTYEVRHAWLRELYKWATSTTKTVETCNIPFLKKIASAQVIRGLGNVEGYKPFENFCESENLVFHIRHLMSAFESSGGRMCLVPSFVLGDADSIRYVYSTTLEWNDRKEAFEEILKQEIYMAKQLYEFNDHYKKEGVRGLDFDPLKFSQLFTYFPALAKSMQGKSREEIEQKFDEILSSKTIYEDYIEQSLNEEFTKFKSTAIAQDIVKASGNLNTYKFPDKWNTILTDKAQKTGDSNADMLKILFLNMKYGEIMHIQMSGISPMFYASTQDMQKRWKQIIASGTRLDREAVDTNGQRVFNEDFSQNVVLFDDYQEDVLEENGEETPFAKLLNHIDPEEDGKKGKINRDLYKKCSLTDGQAFRSLDSYRAIKIALGEWYDNPDNEIFYNKVLELRARLETMSAEEKEEFRNSEEYRNLLHLKSILQPIKAFNYCMEEQAVRDKDEQEVGKMHIPVQFKYSEDVLIPELEVEGSARYKLGIAMQKNGIDLLASTKCVKVGGWGSVKITKEDFLGDTERITKLFARRTNENTSAKAIHHKISLDYYVVQTNVPYHNNSPRAVGTQQLKIAGYAGVMDQVNPEVAENIKKLIGRNRIKLSEYTDGNGQLHTVEIDLDNMSGRDYQKLYSALRTIQWARKGKAFLNKISNQKELTKMLEFSILKDNKAANDLLYGIALNEAGERRIPLCEGLFSTDIVAKLLSILRKDVIHINADGGSAVQVSPLGYDLDMVYEYDEKGNPINVKYAECAIAWDFHYIDNSGKKQQLDYFTYVNPSTGKLIKTNDDGTKVDVERGKEDESDLARQFPGMLDIVAYRIPTERAYSMIALKAVQFFPPCLGGKIAVPRHYTTVAGFDFDIDKLYLLRKTFKEKDEEEIELSKKNYKVWGEVYEEFEDLKKALKEARKAHPQFDKLDLEDYWDQPEVQKVVNELDEVKVLGWNKRDFYEYGRRKYYAKHVSPENRWVGYDASKLFTDQDMSVLNNLALAHEIDRLQSPSTLLERLTPGGFYNIRNSTPIMKRLSIGAVNRAEESFETFKKSSSDVEIEDPSDISTIVHYQTANTIYGKLISKAAIQNAIQKYISMCEKFEVADDDHRILFGSMVNDAASNQKLGVDFTSRYKRSNIDSELLLAELLAASVDAVKEATLEYFGITPDTFNAVATAVKLGANFEDIGLFFNNPLFKEANAILQRNPDLTFGVAVRQAFEALVEANPFSGASQEAQSEYLKTDSLFKAIKEYDGGYKGKTSSGTDFIDYEIKPITDVEMQKRITAVYNMYQKLMDVTRDVVQVTSNSRQDSSNAVDSKFGSLEANIDSAEDVTDLVRYGKMHIHVVPSTENAFSFIGNGDEIIFDENGNIKQEGIANVSTNPFAIPMILTAVEKMVLDATTKIFPYRSTGYIKVKKAIRQLSSDGSMPNEFYEFINMDLPTYLLLRFSGSINGERMHPYFQPEPDSNSNNSSNGLIEISNARGQHSFVTMKDFFRRFFPAVLQLFKNKFSRVIEAEDLQIFKLATPNKTKNGAYITFDGINALDRAQKDRIIDSWNRSFRSEENEYVQHMAYLMAFHNFYTRGFNSFGNNVSNSLFGTECKEHILGYIPFLKALSNLSVTEDGKFSLTQSSKSNTEEAEESEQAFGDLGEFIRLFFMNRAYTDSNGGSFNYKFTKTLVVDDDLLAVNKNSINSEVEIKNTFRKMFGLKVDSNKKAISYDDDLSSMAKSQQAQELEKYEDIDLQLDLTYDRVNRVYKDKFGIIREVTNIGDVYYGHFPPILVVRYGRQKRYFVLKTGLTNGGTVQAVMDGNVPKSIRVSYECIGGNETKVRANPFNLDYTKYKKSELFEEPVYPSDDITTAALRSIDADAQEIINSNREGDESVRRNSIYANIYINTDEQTKDNERVIRKATEEEVDALGGPIKDYLGSLSTNGILVLRKQDVEKVKMAIGLLMNRYSNEDVDTLLPSIQLLSTRSTGAYTVPEDYKNKNVAVVDLKVVRDGIFNFIDSQKINGENVLPSTDVTELKNNINTLLLAGNLETPNSLLEDENSNIFKEIKETEESNSLCNEDLKNN